MANANLTAELAVKLIKGEKVTCPKCSEGKLVSRYTYKNKNTEFKCELCGEIYHPAKMI